MLGFDDLTVGIVAGLIAAGVFLIQFLVPTLTILILVGLLKNENTAATWSVVGRVLHSSHWPTMLRTDSAGTRGVRGSVRLIAVFEILLLLLISVASIVTPLGLYETIVPLAEMKEETFQYAQDNTPMGVGTLSRRNDFGLSRSCWYVRPKACPWTETTIIETSNSTHYSADLPDGYDTRIPRNITEIYSAGINNIANTVSSVFDIQWRTYRKILEDEFLWKGLPKLVGDYRHLSQMVLNDAWEAVTGLVVDTKAGGIGFRNHTTPPTLPYGSTWSEDLLFIEPETECVDMNITLDFNIPRREGLDDVENVVVTDHGGFANLDLNIPWFDENKTYADASLRDRAYFAAWFSNVYTMMYMNITNPKRKPFTERFQYVNSKVGSTFPVDTFGSGSGFKIRYDQLLADWRYGQFVNVGDLTSLNDSLLGTNGTVYSNPFKIGKSNFTDITDACANVNGRYYANISNIAITCGMLYGAARRKDGSASLFFDPGTEWRIPLYSCASASKASIKTVSFRYNGTDGLRSLDITDIKPKEYAKEEDMPLWAVENLKMRLEEVNPIWGMTTPEHSKHPNISTSRQPHLYLPGHVDMVLDDISPASSTQYLAGVDFYSRIMALTYDTEAISEHPLYAMPDYSGKSNLAMYNKWQELSRDPKKAATIINLIWTDISANAVVGAKGQLPTEPLQQLSKRELPATTVKVPVTVYTRRIKFRWQYGIPAFLALFLAALVFLTALVFLCIGRASPSRIRRYLDQTSAGRIFTTFLYPADCPPGASKAQWVRLAGRKRVDIGGQILRATDAVGGAGGVALTTPTAGTIAGNIAYGKLDDGSISMHSLPSPQPYSPMNGQAQSYYDAGGHTVSPAGGEAQSYFNGRGNGGTNGPYTHVPPGSGMLHP